MSRIKIKDSWDDHWIEKKGVKNLIFQKTVSFYRRFLIANQVSIYVDKYFTPDGIFLELGSGTSESSFKISKHNRQFGAIDISKYALSRAKDVVIMDFFVQADIFRLPFKDESIDGIWNIGVMEHFSSNDLLIVLKEFYRVLKKNQNCCCVLFWPWVLAPSHLFFCFFGKILSLIGIYRTIFPEVNSMFNSRKTTEKLLKKSGFERVNFHLPFYDLTHIVVVGYKT